MIRLKFSKYQGTGNDFIMVDNRDGVIQKDNLVFINKLCDRRFGIGSDGLILIENHAQYDFEMIYFNPDGTQSLCGNGSRCAVMFARALGFIQNKTTFLTIEGPLFAQIISNRVHLKMPDVEGIQITKEEDFFVHTGSPHYIQFVENVKEIDVNHTGRLIRNSEAYRPEGTNVNFVQQKGLTQLFVRTYERGVENETLSCGTGVTACALAAGRNMVNGNIDIHTSGGDLTVQFEQPEKGVFRNIYLIGPAEKVYDGMIEI
jgi:diaminopimelate epimerase